MTTQELTSTNSAQERSISVKDRYTLWQILGIWLAAAVPMGLLDWVANSILFSFYHFYQPWGMLTTPPADLIFAFSGRRFRSNWFPIIIHSGQSVFFLFLILGHVPGLA